MSLYYLNTRQQTNGDYEVHTGSCDFLPASENREYLGTFSSCSAAVSEAKSRHPGWDRINGCKFCSKPCHTS